MLTSTIQNRRLACSGAILAVLAVSPAFADDQPAATQAVPISPDKPDSPKRDVPNPMDHLGNGVITRFINYNRLEWGQAGAPDDPSAPASRRSELPPQPVNSPPYPFTEWPYGGTTNLGTNRAASVDSPLMVAIAKTGLGEAMAKAHLQLYGWIDAGYNFSTSKVSGGNAPAAYDYNPNRPDLNQAVVYLERTPDTVQKDHVDWGFRVSAIYGSDYRYTTSFGLVSNQLLGKNAPYGYDFPMVYGEVFFPKVADGLLVRVGRYIALPDIEAQLAPNNYMYSHSLTYTYDNYTNTGVQASLAVGKHIILQLGVSLGSDTALWNTGVHVVNPYPGPKNVLYPGATFLKDPGAIPSVTACARYQSTSARDNIYVCADAINSGVYGYNNLQWYGITYYHKFSNKWHIAIESYNLHQNNVPNINNPVVQNIIANGGTPFSTPSFKYNAPNGAQCKNPAVYTCTASAQSGLFYLNYQPSKLDNISLRGEIYDDMQGQRTGTKAIYKDIGIGLQHWFSPQIEVRPEVTYYWANAAAFNGNSNLGIAPNRTYELVVSGDAILHF